MRILTLIVSTIFVLTSLALAGPNRNVKISARKIDSLNDSISIFAIEGTNLSQCHSYSVELLSTDSGVKLLEASSKNSPFERPFLEKNGGSIAAFLSFPKTNGLEIAAALKGSVLSQTISGNGILGYVYVQSHLSENPEIKVSKAVFLTVDARKDIITEKN